MDPRVLLELSLFDFYSHFKLNFVKPTLFSFANNYYASAHMVASQLHHQIILLFKRPLTHYWTAPLNHWFYSRVGQCVRVWHELHSRCCHLGAVGWCCGPQANRDQLLPLKGKSLDHFIMFNDIEIIYMYSCHRVMGTGWEP